LSLGTHPLHAVEKKKLKKGHFQNGEKEEPHICAIEILTLLHRERESDIKKECYAKLMNRKNSLFTTTQDSKLYHAVYTQQCSSSMVSGCANV